MIIMILLSNFVVLVLPKIVIRRFPELHYFNNYILNLIPTIQIHKGFKTIKHSLLQLKY